VLRSVILIVAGSLAIGNAWAQEVPKTYAIALTAQQVEQLSKLGADCLDKQPYACARVLLFWQDKLVEATQPKPEAK